MVDKKELFQKENAPLLYKLINYTVKIAAVVLLVVVSVTIYKYQELVKKIRGTQTYYRVKLCLFFDRQEQVWFVIPLIFSPIPDTYK